MTLAATSLRVNLVSGILRSKVSRKFLESFGFRLCQKCQGAVNWCPGAKVTEAKPENSCDTTFDTNVLSLEAVGGESVAT